MPEGGERVIGAVIGWLAALPILLVLVEATPLADGPVWLVASVALIVSWLCIEAGERLSDQWWRRPR